MTGSPISPEQMSDEAFLASSPLATPSAWNHTVVEAVRRLGTKGPLLDAGCNCGLTLGLLGRAGLAPLTGVDVDPDAVGKARLLLRHLGYEADVRTADLTATLPFEDGAFEIVVCSEVLEHIPQPERAARELARVLRPDGHLVATTPVRSRSSGHLRPPSDHVPGDSDVRHFHWSEMSPAEFQQLFTGAGLEIVEHRGFNLRGEGTLGNRGLRPLYAALHRLRPLSSRLGRNQLIVARR